MRSGIKLHSSNFEPPMSALPPKADIAACDRHVRFVPKADIGRKARPFDLLHVMDAAAELRLSQVDRS
jgi:hypothetical protein